MSYRKEDVEHTTCAAVLLQRSRFMIVNISHADQEKISQQFNNAKHFVVPAFHVCVVGFFLVVVFSYLNRHGVMLMIKHYLISALSELSEYTCTVND